LRKISAPEAARIEAARVESARLELARRQQAATQRRLRMRTQNSVLAIAACLALIVIFAVGLSVVDVVPTSTGAPSGEPSADRFTATRTGIVRVEDVGRNRCRQVDFDNETGRFSNEMRVPCHDPTSAADVGSRMPKSQAGDRFEAIRGSFVKK
jgi:hypothetical protein